ncbi:MAG: hypothetical protein NWR72_17585, partial [Bacteroidia bacterium]|nr:hypothetical protein [Bacteroidia bacterium]
GYEGPSRVVGVNFYGNLVGISLPETYLATLPHAGLFRTVDCEAGKSVTQRKGISIFSGASLRIL